MIFFPGFSFRKIVIALKFLYLTYLLFVYDFNCVKLLQSKSSIAERTFNMTRVSTGLNCYSSKIAKAGRTFCLSTIFIA
jgi:hypothetical protein